MMNFLDLPTLKNLLLTVKEMNVLDDYSKDLLEKSKNGFILSCASGHLTVAKWLLGLGTTCSYPTCSFETMYSQSSIHPTAFEYAFRLACENGHLTVAQWLYSLGEVNIHSNSEDAFQFACHNNHLAIAKWLYSLGVDIHANNEYAFRLSCRNGNLTVAKWLLGLGTTCSHPTCPSGTMYSLGVDIHAANEDAFVTSCRNGHLTVAQWLYSLGEVDIYADNGAVFRYATEDILDWLNHLII